jgi:signal transduction histidine kinase
MATEDFSKLVSLACHDLRTPLATVFGFARTMNRPGVDETIVKYAGMIEAASQQLAGLIDELALAARIEDGRYDPARAETDTAELAQAAANALGDGRVTVTGAGGRVEVDREATERAVAALVRCTLRHGGLDHVDAVADGAEIRVTPVTPSSAPVLVGDDLRDLGAAVAVRLVRALGGDVGVAGETLTIRLPA